ncbi:MAG: N-acetylmuramyl-L-alanine amidase, negative regulator of AmpC, AmpD [Acidimicrobiaceae bacterium]|nr:N-acetylmuramyl-L-alanine amidase, negative regulator of AmpC, AmpD [Acidimicrobiaceae bacterium]
MTTAPPRYPHAAWHGPVPNQYGDLELKPVLGVVLHVMEGSISSCDNWFHDSAAQVSAHLGNPKTGAMWQWVELDKIAWAEAGGNGRWISVEHEGFAPESLTDSQLENDAQLLAWLHQQVGVPLQLADTPTASGLGYHAMGGASWGGHYGCPGPAIVAQRPAIIARAKEILTPPPPPAELIVAHPNGGEALVDLTARQWAGIPNPADLRGLVARGVKRGNVPPLWWTSAHQVAWKPAEPAGVL